MTWRNALALAVWAAALLGSTGCSESTKNEPIAPAGKWTATGSLAVPRANFRGGVATLASGKVLVAGGLIATFPVYTGTAAVEIYDPAAGTWTTVAPMAAARGQQCLVRLPSGKVLMAGGVDYVGLLATADVYDPAIDTWSPVGSMTVAHNMAPCVLLDSGKVLIAGGYSAAGPSVVAELYDPDTGLFTPTRSMATGRGWHTATLLASGKVLVAGGCTGAWEDCYESTASAELYDPATRSWSDAGSMPFPVVAHTATRLTSGKVLVAGGCLTYRGTGTSCGNLDRDRRASLYDPVAGTWSATGSLSVGRQDHAAMLLASGEVLVAGGTAWSGNSRTTERYDPATGLWTAGPSMLHSHGSGLLSAKLPDGTWLVVGGTWLPYPPQYFTGAAEIFTEAP